MRVILKALAMVRPSADFVQAPSKLRGSVELSDADFAEIADTGKAALVSLEDDGVSNPQQITAYTLPADVQLESGKVAKWGGGRYIVADEK